MDLNDTFTLATIAAWTAIALATIISLLILYVVIRLAVSHALRAHHRWRHENT